MTVSLYVRVSVNGKRRYTLVNKKLYPEGTVFCLRYARKWETISAKDLTAALPERVLTQAALLTEPLSVAKAPAKRVGIDDAITVYLKQLSRYEKAPDAAGIHAGYKRFPKGLPR